MVLLRLNSMLAVEIRKRPSIKARGRPPTTAPKTKQTQKIFVFISHVCHGGIVKWRTDRGQGPVRQNDVIFLNENPLKAKFLLMSM